MSSTPSLPSTDETAPPPEAISLYTAFYYSAMSFAFIASDFAKSRIYHSISSTSAIAASNIAVSAGVAARHAAELTHIPIIPPVHLVAHALSPENFVISARAFASSTNAFSASIRPFVVTDHDSAYVVRSIAFSAAEVALLAALLVNN